jgi:hypothetical protein
MTSAPRVFLPSAREAAKKPGNPVPEALLVIVLLYR